MNKTGKGGRKIHPFLCGKNAFVQGCVHMAKKENDLLSKSSNAI